MQNSHHLSSSCTCGIYQLIHFVCKESTGDQLDIISWTWYYKLILIKSIALFCKNVLEQTPVKTRQALLLSIFTWMDCFLRMWPNVEFWTLECWTCLLFILVEFCTADYVMFRGDRLLIYNVFNTIFQLNNFFLGNCKVKFMVSIITPSDFNLF